MTVYHLTVDAIEEGVAAVEQEGRLRHLPVSMLPAGVKEGDILEVRVEQTDGAARTTITIDRAATEKARRRSEAQVAAKRPGNDPGGNIVL